LCGCQKSTGPETDYGWAGDTTEIESMILDKIVWFVPGEYSWEVHKTWRKETEPNEMQRIFKLITEAKKDTFPWRMDYKLSLYFYGSAPSDVKVLDVYFDDRQLRINKKFVGLPGENKELGKILLKYLPDEEEPYYPPWIDPNRVIEAQKSLQEYAEKRQKER
jgi:hypothetical protein